MGLLADIRNGKRDGGNGAFAVFFWIAAGAVLALGVGAAASLPGSVVGPLMVVGGLAGSPVGFYAAWGASRVARVLAIPGVVLGFLFALAS